MQKTENKNDPAEKPGLHTRNPHRFRYNFSELVNSLPELSRYVAVNRFGNESIDFADPSAVKALNRALLRHFYGISNWDIPENYLCPPVPGRADYIHHIADLLGSCNSGIIPAGKTVSILDIGVGANCIYPIIGCISYGWHFTGTDIDPVSIESARKIINSNSALTGLVELKIQKNPSNIFRSIIKMDESFDVTICNPPFHSSPGDAESGTLRKLNNLNSEKISTPVLNFGGQNRELWTPGGEEFFVNKMIEESAQYRENCFWFTTLISKKQSLPAVYKLLKKSGTAEVRTINMSQGQKISRIVAWTFMDKENQKKWSNEHWSGKA